MPAPDLVSLVLTLAPPKPLPAPGHLGRAVHALLLRLIQAEAPALAEAIHNTHTSKPFTCSTLIGGEIQETPAERLYRPAEPAWLRFTGLNEAVAAHLLRLEAAPPDTVELDGHTFIVQSATTDPEAHPWANKTSYEALGTPYLLAHRPPSFRLSLEFASPTTFRSQGRSRPVPMPDWVFGSLLDRWNAFSRIQVAQEMRRFADECVVMSKYRLRTRAIPLKNRVVQMGCVGWADYVCLNRDKYWASMLNLMADYAFYSGVGYQTTVGLGQVQRKQRPKPARAAAQTAVAP